MSVTQIQRVCLPVSDQDRAKAFFIETLGLSLRGDMPVPMGENARWIEVAAKSGPALVLTTWLGMPAGSVKGLMLETSDIDADAQRLKLAGVAIDGPRDTPWGRQVSFADPDGNSFVLSTPAP